MLLIQMNVLFLSFQTLVLFHELRYSHQQWFHSCHLSEISLFYCLLVFFFIFSSNLCFSGENGIILFSSFLPFKLSWKYSRFRSRVREIVVTFRTWPSMKLTKRKKQEYIDNKKGHILDKKRGIFWPKCHKMEIFRNSGKFFLIFLIFFPPIR